MAGKKDAGKVAVITGAGSGIGRCLALQMAARGAHVAACDLNRDAAEQTAGTIASIGGSAQAEAVDVSDYDAVKAMAASVISAHGRIDYLFNNAGMGIGGEARDISIEHWRKVLNVNLNGVIHGIDAVYPHMVERGHGHIVNTASLDGLVPFPNHISYTASKYAVVGLSLALRVEAAPLGVRVSVVCPGRVKTPIFDRSELVNCDRDKTMKIAAAPPGITPETCARRIIEGMDRNQDMILPSLYAQFMWTLERLHPRLVHGVMCQTQRLAADLRINRE
jgi:NAD(P)-dependent dehydrogenase (short-subunit alcohol dehydrogenase family)